jgi:hypothetical protein
MNTTIGIAEIVNEAIKIQKKVDKVAYLQQHNSKELRNILKLMYDKSMEFNIPNTAPPYTPTEHPDTYGALYREARKLKYFVKGFGGENLKQAKRENMFIEMLESVHPTDADLLINMIAQKPLKGLPPSVINGLSPGLVPEKESKKSKKETETTEE